MPGRTAGWIGSAAIGLAFLNALGALVQLQDRPAEERHVTSSLWDYAATAGIDVQLGILVDPLAVFMALVVSGVSFLIHVYSVAYMAGDRGYARYFSYLNFFVFSMLLLVLAGNFVLLIVGWAFVGFASYALISFWYRRRTATYAGMKAFVINVVGDVGAGARRDHPPARHRARSTSPACSSARREVVLAERVGDRRGLPADHGRRVREVGADPAPHLAAGRDGGPDAGLRADPRRDDGDRGRVPDRAHAPAVRAGARRRPTSRPRSARSRWCSRPRSRWSSPTSSGSSPTRRSARSAT